jgi:hypothetical protein
MPWLKIREASGADIAEKPAYAIGSCCTWEVYCPGVSLTNIRWTVDGAINDFVINDGKKPRNEPLLLELTTFVGKKPKWFWSKIGQVTVTVRAIAGGKTAERTIGVRVKGAQNISFTSVTDDVKVAKLELTDTIPALTFGNAAGSGKHGICWTAKITAPPCRGELSFTQVMTVWRQFTLVDGRIITHTSNDVWVLDEDFLYGVTERGIEDDGEATTVSCLADECLVLEEADSPSTRLPRTITQPSRVHTLVGDYKKVAVKEAFRTFLMYRPKDGVWVSLADLSWDWAGVAEYEIDKWVLKSKEFSISPVGTVRTMFPLWRGNRDDFF